MESALNAIELTGMIDENRMLRLEDALPFSGPRRVRVIVLFPSEEESDETEWLRSASVNSAFGFLEDEGEDIYSLEDGKTFNDKV